MLRISKMADYGTIVMVYLATFPNQAPSASVIAQHTQLATPTVSKILKRLTKAGLLVSQRGVKGGYSLAKPASDISIAQIIDAMDGKLGLTACSHHAGTCSLEPFCTVRGHWHLINDAINHTLQKLSLVDMLNTDRIGIAKRVA